ncbi:hypothetical protein Tco_1347062, partial [Tanacetum coccineum]
ISPPRFEVSKSTLKAGSDKEDGRPTRILVAASDKHGIPRRAKYSTTVGSSSMKDRKEAEGALTHIGSYDPRRTNKLGTPSKSSTSETTTAKYPNCNGPNN